MSYAEDIMKRSRKAVISGRRDMIVYGEDENRNKEDDTIQRNAYNLSANIARNAMKQCRI